MPSKKAAPEKSRSTRKLDTISKSTNDLSIPSRSSSTARSPSSFIPIASTALLSKTKSNSVSSLKKAPDIAKKASKKAVANPTKESEVKKAAAKNSTKSEKSSSSSKSVDSKKSESNFFSNKAQEKAPAEKTFKRTIINKKLPVRLNLKNKRQSSHDNAETQSANKPDSDQVCLSRHDLESIPLKKEKLNCRLENMSQKREIVLHKDQNLGFGFIAGSEKPIVIRFVTPGFYIIEVLL